MNFGDKVNIAVQTMFGLVPVEFTVVDVLPNSHYALIAQNRLVVGQQKAGNDVWILSQSIDLLNTKPITGIEYKALNSDDLYSTIKVPHLCEAAMCLNVIPENQKYCEEHVDLL